jgi:hypothetical protein
LAVDRNLRRHVVRKDRISSGLAVLGTSVKEINCWLGKT